MTQEVFFDYLLEFFYIVAGAQFVYTGYRSFKDQNNDKRRGSSLFWCILGIIFIGGRWIPHLINGVLVCALAGITLFKQFKGSTNFEDTSKQATASADRRGLWIFLPVIVMAVIAISVSSIIPASSRTALGIASTAALIVAVFVFKPKKQEILDETNRMTQSVGTTAILPQLLAALGTIFVAAGVGELVSQIIGSFVPDSSIFWGSVAYVIGMVIFTMIMGNAFAAFTVITAGIGIPFVISQGADPYIAGALAMTAGYCGTLLSPLAGNFNALPAALLEMDDPNGVIKRQAPIAFIMIIVHILLMYFWAF